MTGPVLVVLIYVWFAVLRGITSFSMVAERSRAYPGEVSRRELWLSLLGVVFWPVTAVWSLVDVAVGVVRAFRAARKGE